MLVFLSSGIPKDADAAMSLEQMKSLKGAAQLEITLEKLFQRCGLPARIFDHGPADGTKNLLKWRNETMRLSATDWDVIYGTQQPKLKNINGWVNGEKLDNRCMSELSQLQLNAKGHVGVLNTVKKNQGFGYITTYKEPKDLFKAHKVISIMATLSRNFAVSTLTGRFGWPDEVINVDAARSDYRYWVVGMREQRPESLYAVDFHINSGICISYVISTRGFAFVQQRLDLLVRQWEKNYIMD